jgi:hypothetical protein
MVGAVDQSLRGIAAGIDRLDAAVGRIARDGADGDLLGNMVALVRARQEISVNLTVVRTANEMIGSVLDVWA